MKVMQAPLFLRMHSHDTGQNPPHSIVRFEAADQKIYEVRVVASIVPITLATMSAHMSRLPTQREGQPLRLASSQKFVAEDGRGGLALHCDAGITLALVIHPELLAALRAQIAELEEILKPPEPEAAKH